MIAIWKREWRAYFHSMIGYLFLAVFFIITAVYFFVFNIIPARAEFSLVLSGVSMIFVLLMPVLTMRLFSEERKQKTEVLLITSPVSIPSIVLGKFFSAMSVLAFALALTVIFPVLLGYYGDLAIAQTIGAYVGLFLLGCSCISVGILVSSLTENQAAAAVAGFGILFFMFMIENVAPSLPQEMGFSIAFTAFLALMIAMYFYGFTKNIKIVMLVLLAELILLAAFYFMQPALYPKIPYQVFHMLSLFGAFSDFVFGIFNVSAVVYYIAFTCVFLYLTVKTIEKKRWS